MENQQVTDPVLKPSTSRPFLLLLLCVFSFVFFGLIGLLFLVSLFYSGSVTLAINEYIPEGTISTSRVILIAFAGFLLHAIIFTGILLIFKMRKKGYLLFGSASLIVCVYQLFQDKISLFTTFIYIILIVLFGLFYKKLG